MKPPNGSSSSLSPITPLTPSRSLTPLLFSHDIDVRESGGLEDKGGRWRKPPVLLDTEEFRRAWGEWIDYQLEIRSKYHWPVSNRVFQKTIQKCLEWGVDRSVAAIDYSIEMGYRGLFEPRNFEKPKPHWEDNWKPGACL